MFSIVTQSQLALDGNCDRVRCLSHVGTEGRLFSAYADVATGVFPAAVSISAFFTGPQPDDRYFYQQELSASHKWFLRPKRFALSAGTTLILAELRARNSDDMIDEGVIVGTAAYMTGSVQLASRLTLYLGVSGTTPLLDAHDLAARPSLGTGATLLLAFRRWDFFASGALGDVTRQPSTFLSAGFTKRWGI